MALPVPSFPDISIGDALEDDDRIVTFPLRHPSPNWRTAPAESIEAGIPDQSVNPLDLIEDLKPRFVGKITGGRIHNVRTPEDLEEVIDRFLAHPERGDYLTRSDVYRSGAWLLIRAYTDRWRIYDPYLRSLLIERELQAQAEWAAKWENSLLRFSRHVRDYLTTTTNYEGWDEIRAAFAQWDRAFQAHPNEWRRHHYQIAIRDLPITRCLIAVGRAQSWSLPLFLIAAPQLPALKGAPDA